MSLNTVYMLHFWISNLYFQVGLLPRAPFIYSTVQLASLLRCVKDFLNLCPKQAPHYNLPNMYFHSLSNLGNSNSIHPIAQVFFNVYHSFTPHIQSIGRTMKMHPETYHLPWAVPPSSWSKPSLHMIRLFQQLPTWASFFHVAQWSVFNITQREPFKTCFIVLCDFSAHSPLMTPHFSLSQ